MIIPLRSRSWLLLMLLTAAGVLALLSVRCYPRWAKLRAQDAFLSQLPDARRIEKISVRIDDLRDSFGGSIIPEFELPVKYHSIILKVVLPAKRYDYPRDWDDTVLGHITITTLAGETLALAWVNAGKNSLCFSADGVHYMRRGPYQAVDRDKYNEYRIDEGARLLSLIREIYEEQTTKKKRFKIPEIIDELERSIGEKPTRGLRN